MHITRPTFRPRSVHSLAVLLILVVAIGITYCISPIPPARAAGYPIGGKILEEYNQTGGSGFFGDAITREADAGRGGKFQKFYKNSSIYWHPLVTNGHANQIGGAIRDKWGQLGYENGALKYPTSRELATRVAGGRFNRFEGGNIYYSADAGTHHVWGAMLEKWGSLDYEAGPLGFAIGDEFDAKDGGKGQNFQGGSIYWSPATGAHVVWGLIGQNWADNNFENGVYGYPTSDEYADNEYEKGRRQDFQNGHIGITDMTVPYSGYSDPGTDARRAPTPPAPDAPSSSLETPTAPSTDAPTTTEPTTPSTADPELEPPTAPGTTQSQPSTQPSLATTPSAPVVPAVGNGLYTAGGSLIVTPATWPFGDFCVFGTKGGPGGACRGSFNQGWSQNAFCIAAIAYAAGSLIFAASKIVKIRAFIKESGGVKEAFDEWQGALTSDGRAEAWAKTGKVTKTLALEFLGLPAIAAAC